MEYCNSLCKGCIHCLGATESKGHDDVELEEEDAMSAHDEDSMSENDENDKSAGDEDEMYEYRYSESEDELYEDKPYEEENYLQKLMKKIEQDINEIEKCCKGIKLGHYIDRSTQVLYLNIGIQINRLNIGEELANVFKLDPFNSKGYISLQLKLEKLNTIENDSDVKFIISKNKIKYDSKKDEDYNKSKLPGRKLLFSFIYSVKITSFLSKTFDWLKSYSNCKIKTIPTHLIQKIMKQTLCDYEIAVQTLESNNCDMSKTIEQILQLNLAKLDTELIELKKTKEAEQLIYKKEELHLPKFLQSIGIYSANQFINKSWENEIKNWNIIIQIVHYFEQSILETNEKCIICNNDLKVKSLKPYICDETLCTTIMDMYGFSFSLLEELKKNKEISSILITLLFYAVKSNRIELCFPENVSSQDGRLKFCTINSEGIQEKNVYLLKSVVQLIPTIEYMIVLSENKDTILQNELNKIHPLIYPLLKWTFISFRGHLRKLSFEDKLIKHKEGIQEFVLQSGPVDINKQFEKLRNKYGSFWAWHGSSIANWHSILRNGLQVLSNTKYMTTGAVYGEGIYHSLDFSLSINYSIGAYTGSSLDSSMRPFLWEESIHNNVLFIALCEIINVYNDIYPTKEDIKYVEGVNYYIVKKPELVATRILMVVPNISEYTTLKINIADIIQAVSKK